MKRALFFKTSDEAGLLENLSITGLRIFVGFTMAFSHGIGKLPPSEQFIFGVGQLGFPSPEIFAWAASLSEFLGGLFIGIGLLTRPSAAFLAFTMGVAAFLRHADDPFQKKELALLYFFVALIFALRGASRYSMDRFISKSMN